MGLLATRAVFETAPPAGGSVAMLWTSDEETGSRTSRALIEAEARRATPCWCSSRRWPAAR